MTAEHTTWLAEEDDGTVTAHCHSCNWQGTERVSNRDWAAQEADLHTAIKAGRTTDCCAANDRVLPEHEGNDFAVCPACGLTVEVHLCLISKPEWRYAPHNMIVDGLEGWEETLRAAQEGGMLAVRRINERAKKQAQQALIRDLSAELRHHKPAS